MSSFVQLRLPLPVRAFRMSAADRELKAVLGRLAGRHSEVWHSTETIAARLGVTVRAAQCRINRLIANGLLERVWDYSLNTRRRLRLLWRGAESFNGSVSANSCTLSTQPLAPTIEPPPHPPIGERIETKEENTLSSYAAPALPPPPGGNCCAVEEDGGISPEVVAELKTAAAEAMPADKAAPFWAIAQAKKWGGAWVLAALRRVVSKSQTNDPANDPRAFAFHLLKSYAAEGGPSLSETETIAAREAREATEKATRIAAMEAEIARPMSAWEEEYYARMAAEI